MNRLSPYRAIRSLSIFSSAFGATSQVKDSSTKAMAFRTQSYLPTNPDGSFPHSQQDLTPMDAGDDASFYLPSRFVTHIDDNAIITLKRYYDENLPRKGRILDFCSSWISHYPSEIEKAASAPNAELNVVGTGMNEQELKRNAVLKAWTVQDLNQDPDVRIPDSTGNTSSDILLNAATCVVSIDYLTKPVEVLISIRKQTVEGGKVHLAISNRCFPTKAVGKWLQVSEQERLEMVGDYLHWAGWHDIEIVTLVEPGSWLKDPLWVVRGTKPAS